MDNPTSDDEYSVQYFGFTPSQFFRDYSEMILDEMATIIHEGMDKSQYATSDYSQTKILEYSKEVHENWCKQAEVVLPALKPIINKWFVIPKHVLLPEDELNRHIYSEEEVSDLRKEVEQLEAQLKNETDEIAQCRTHLNLLDQLKPVMADIDKRITFVKKIEDKLNSIKELREMVTKFEEKRKEVLEDDIGSNSEGFCASDR